MARNMVCSSSVTTTSSSRGGSSRESSAPSTSMSLEKGSQSSGCSSAGSLPSRANLRKDESNLPPCLRLYHERRRLASVECQQQKQEFIVPPAFRNCISYKRAKQSMLNDLTASQHDKKSTRHQIEERLNLKRATWRELALRNSRQQENQLQTLQVLKEAVRQAKELHESAVEQSSSSNDLSDAPSSPSSTPGPSEIVRQVARTKRKTTREKRKLRRTAALKIQACFRGRQGRLRFRLLQMQQQDISRERTVRRGHVRKTSEITMSELGDTLHSASNPHQDVLRFSRHTQMTDLTDDFDDSLHSLGDFHLSPKQDKFYQRNYASSSDLGSAARAPRQHGNILPRSQLEQQQDIRVTQAFGHTSYTSYFTGTDLPVKRPQRTISPKMQTDLKDPPTSEPIRLPFSPNRSDMEESSLVGVPGLSPVPTNSYNRFVSQSFSGAPSSRWEDLCCSQPDEELSYRIQHHQPSNPQEDCVPPSPPPLGTDCPDSPLLLPTRKISKRPLCRRGSIESISTSQPPPRPSFHRPSMQRPIFESSPQPPKRKASVGPTTTASVATLAMESEVSSLTYDDMTEYTLEDYRVNHIPTPPRRCILQRNVTANRLCPESLVMPERKKSERDAIPHLPKSWGVGKASQFKTPVAPPGIKKLSHHPLMEESPRSVAGEYVSSSQHQRMELLSRAASATGDVTKKGVRK